MSLPISKFKNIFILLGVLALLLVGLGVYQGQTASKNKRNPASFFGVNFDKVTKIRVTGTNGLYENILEKKKDDWIVASAGDYLINPKYIDDLKDILQNMPKGELASRDKGKHEELQVDKVGIALQAWQGDTLVADAVIGKEGPGFTFTYIRKADSDNVYLVPQNIRPIFNRTDWRDKRVWIFDPKKVTAIDWRYKDVEISLLKTKDGWRQISPISTPSSDEKVGPELVKLSDLYASNIDEQISRKDAGLESKKLDIRIELTFETGEKDALIVGDKIKDKEEYYVARENGKLIYTLDSYTVEETLKKEIGAF
ncbi:MAG: hypothetical protein A3H70_03465 [Candidatus Komeilibacteria bacterium RIFCSPLOWO2_02_FULL_48_11]|uniref:DUF4340 domain-containing protein n=1 Tax=Candidatus Komeilibacteria bacterium RIFCSPLOWO2_02_FULL_48_11 TaxID=1798553 RepID=A0A1G2BT02_9BACT|nr:MAG: hypothetical protein A3H70_03465 [Candidatus Komeilibacteria bacterium RIFCSPLOWO2_02_FULL_48_11]